MIAACVMTLEARDNAAKIVPATACLESPAPVRMNKSMRENRFQSSASQTTFIDRDIVAVLTRSQNSIQKSALTALRVVKQDDSVVVLSKFQTPPGPLLHQM